MINKKGDQKISGHELNQFLIDNNVKNRTVQESNELINEYDSSRSGNLQFDEFINIFLPAGD